MLKSYISKKKCPENIFLWSGYWSNYIYIEPTPNFNDSHCIITSKNTSSCDNNFSLSFPCLSLKMYNDVKFNVMTAKENIFSFFFFCQHKEWRGYTSGNTIYNFNVHKMNNRRKFFPLRAIYQLIRLKKGKKKSRLPYILEMGLTKMLSFFQCIYSTLFILVQQYSRF